MLVNFLVAGSTDFSKAAMVVCAIAFAVAAFIDINIGLVAILLSMLLSPELEAGAVGSRAIVIRAEDVLLIIVSLTWLAKMAVKKTPLIRQSPLNVPIGLYIAVLCLSTARGMFLGNVAPLKGAFYVFKLIEYFVLYFIVLNETTNIKQVKIFLGVLFFVGVIVGIYGNTHIGDIGRISAPFEGEGEPNTLGGYVLFLLSLLGGLIYYYKKRRRILLLVFLFLVPTFLFTLSRASYMGAIPALIVFVVLAKDKRVLNTVLMFALIGILIFAFGPPVLKSRVLGTFQPEEQQALKEVGGIRLGPSPAARVESWTIALKDKLPKRPALGYGVTGAGFLDSQYILVLVETGIIGFLVFMWLMWRVWRSALYAYNTVKSPLFKGIAMGFLVGFVGILFHAVGSNSFVIIRIAEPFWFFAAIVVKLVDIETGKAAMEDLRMR